MTSLHGTRHGYCLICFGAAQLGNVCAVRGGLQLIDPLPKDTSCSRTSHRGETLLVLWEEHGGAIHHYQPGILSMQKGSKFDWWTKGCSCRPNMKTWFCKHDLALRRGPSVPARALLNYTFVRSKHSCPIGLKQVNTRLVAGTMENWTGDLARTISVYYWWTTLIVALYHHICKYRDFLSHGGTPFNHPWDFSPWIFYIYWWFFHPTKTIQMFGVPPWARWPVE